MDHLARLVDHLEWANTRVLDSLRAADGADSRVLELFGHLVAAEHVWQTRLEGKATTVAVWPALSLDQAALLAAENVERLRKFVSGLKPADLDREVTYTNTAGQTFTTGVQDILLHVALHGAYHRGQIAIGLRSAGRVPASTDFIAFVRGVPAATRTSRPKVRTPDERFANLPGFPFEPRYLEVDGLRIHYVDEGPRDGEIVLLLHGEPTWSYLYRKMIPVLASAGLRAIAPDLIGFGRSDKLLNRDQYSYAFHVDIVKRFVNSLDLQGITLVGQDWGGLIGLRVAAELEERFARIVAANTGLPDGKAKLNPAFFQWQQYSQTTPDFVAGKIVGKGTVSGLTPEEAAAYDAPFPDPTFQAGARAFPMLVPTTPDDPAVPANLAAWDVLRRWSKPFLTAFSDRDPIMAGGERVFQKLVPGTRGQPHVTITGAGHFLQEDQGPELARAVALFVHANPR